MSATAQPARLLGIPLGDFGFFSCILLSLASGFLAFFGSCFLAIIGLLCWNSLMHQAVNYADSYRYVGLPTGVAVLVFGFLFLATAWLRRLMREAR